MDSKKLEQVIALHREWLAGSGGKQAYLSGANLSGADLHSANLHSANLRSADLSGANLSGANLRYANLSGASLRSANLRYANLSGASLHSADLWCCTGNMREVKSVHVDRYAVVYTKDVMQIGCERHDIADWFEFSAERIARMDDGALDWWEKFRPVIKMLIELSPCSGGSHEP